MSRSARLKMETPTGPTAITMEEKGFIVECLAAGYTFNAILSMAGSRGYNNISKTNIQTYSKNYRVQIKEKTERRFQEAIAAGLAKKEERVARLVRHAEKLEALNTDAQDEKGTLIISKEYRETLGDIASEVGDRQKNIDITTKGKPIIMEDVVRLLDQRDRKKSSGSKNQ